MTGICLQDTLLVTVGGKKSKQLLCMVCDWTNSTTNTNTGKRPTAEEDTA